jgi:hypothetical protein
MIEYECWFCGKGVDQHDALAVVVSARNLWSSNDDDPTQYLYIHSECAAERLPGARMSFEPSDLINPN